MRAAAIAFAALSGTLTVSAGAFPGPAPRHPSTARISNLGPAALRFGRSIGSPTDGHLIGGAHLEEAPYLRIMPADLPGDVRWGLEPLVAMLERSARQVRHQFPEAITSVGHLSREGGGDIVESRSHESGRDADVGFFVKSSGGRQLLPTHFVPFRGDGTAPTWPGANFDDARNWAFVSALVSDPEAHVTHIFVASPLRARLLAYAERTGAPSAIRIRAAEVLQQPHGALPHDDHFHVRIGCPAHMSGCVENPMARGHHVSVPVLAHGRRPSPSRGLVTPAPTPRDLTPPPSPAAEPTPKTDDVEPTDDAPPALMQAPVDDVDG